MKVAHVINTFPGYHKRVGGGEQAALRLIRKLKQHGVENIIYTLKYDLEPSDKEFNVFSWPVVEDFLGPISKFAGVLKWYLFQFDPLVFVSALLAFKRTKPDVVHLHNMYTLTFAPLVAARLLGIPVILSIYDYWYFCPLSTLSGDTGSACRKFHGTHCGPCLPHVLLPVQKLLLLFRKAVFGIFYKSIARFIALSRSSKDILKSYGINEKNIGVVPVDIPEEFNAGAGVSRPEANTVLFIGWLQKRKGLSVALDAMMNIWKELPEAKIKIITQEVKWEEAYKNAITEKLRTMDKNKYEYMSGQVERSEIKRSLEEAAVVVVPEQWENMSPLMVIEAMFMGKAIVASNIGGIPEFITDNETGLLFKGDAPAELADRTLLLLRDKGLAARLGANARDWITNHSKISEPHKKMIEVYEKLTQ